MNGKLGYLCAYSGVVTGEQQDEYFVPLVFNMFQENSLYAQKSNELRILTEKIKELETNSQYLQLTTKLNKLKEQRTSKLDNEKNKQQVKRNMRKNARELVANSLKPEEIKALLAKHQQESMATKFMLKEYKIYLDEQIDNVQRQITPISEQLKNLKIKRKELSKFLQEWIFKQYRFLNADGKTADALSLFKA